MEKIKFIIFLSTCTTLVVTDGPDQNSDDGVTEGAVLQATASTEDLEKLFEGGDLVGVEGNEHLLQLDRKKTDFILKEIFPSVLRKRLARILQTAHHE